MQRALCWAPALASALLILAAPVRAADGIKASATAVREVPVDILTLTINMTERIAPGESAADQRDILSKALEAKGLRVLERTVRYLPTPGGTYGASQFNLFSNSGAARDPIEVRNVATFRITGFKRVQDVLEILGRHGVRPPAVTAHHSKAEEVRQELRKEAIERAIAQARRLAAQAGVKTGGVLDLSTQPPQTLPPGFGGGIYAAFVPGQDLSLIDPRQPGELPRLRITVSASVVLAIRPE
jgi:uncharacterized protein YggE